MGCPPTAPDAVPARPTPGTLQRSHRRMHRGAAWHLHNLQLPNSLRRIHPALPLLRRLLRVHSSSSPMRSSASRAQILPVIPVAEKSSAPTTRGPAMQDAEYSASAQPVFFAARPPRRDRGLGGRSAPRQWHLHEYTPQARVQRASTVAPRNVSAPSHGAARESAGLAAPQGGD